MGIDEINIEADGYVTREQDLRRRPLEKVTDNTANPTSECCYPECEKCRDYVRYEGANYCTVPMVINKQTWRLTADLIADMKREIDEVREMVYDHILGEKTRDETGNYSFSQANSGSVCGNCAYFMPLDGDFGHCAIYNKAVTTKSGCICRVFMPEGKW